MVYPHAMQPIRWNINNSNVTRREYTETLQGVTTGGTLIGNSSIIPLGLMSTHDVLKMDFSLRDCGANGGMQVLAVCAAWLSFVIKVRVYG